MSNENIGKRVFDDLYVHISAIDSLDHVEHRDSVQAALSQVPADADFAPNVAKINLKTGRLSLLAYIDFDTEPFPQLARSWSFVAGNTSDPILRKYDDSLNPPILHRKEQLVYPSHPYRHIWSQLTSTAESLGLFDDTRTIGFRLNWERLIESKGYRLVDGQFQPIGNELQGEHLNFDRSNIGAVHRHLTALSRNNLSAPVQMLLRHGLLPEGGSFFDYGCGRGGDVATLVAGGFTSQGWDPHYAPDNTLVEADAVNLGFVVNVIEDPAERVEAIHKAFKLARRVLSIGVMLYSGDQPGKPFRDGFLTSRNTFQKYFSQGELKDYIEHVLHQEAFMVAPGIAFVFADKDLEQQFNAGRYRSTGVAARLLATRLPRVRVERPLRERLIRAPRPSRTELLLEVGRPFLDSLWTTTLELGRYPEEEETPGRESVEAQFGSVGKALRLLHDNYDQSLLDAAAQTRSDDLRLFFAMQQFGKRPAYRTLEPRLQRDVKAFFGDYRSAQVAGLRLLTEAADVDLLRESCVVASESGLGDFDDHALQLHLSLVERLPVVLRAYVACGLILYNSVSDFQLVKIHVESGKLTLLQYDDFEASPLPLMVKRIKVNIRIQDYDVFDYIGPQHPKPFLFWKSRYINEDLPGFAEQQIFDEELSATGLVADIERGPLPDQLHELLHSKRLEIQGFRLIRSQSLPDSEDSCGANFIYRDFIECGETQKRLAIPNLPLRPETYNALYDLATNILDPLIDYFGAIRLTYGFCSPGLSKHIKGRIAPKLDQHAGLELARGGTPVCDRGGAACDLVVEDEDMREVADWIVANLPFDRLYYYGASRPIHVSFGPQHSRAAFEMFQTASGSTVPRPLRSARREPSN